MVNSLPSVNFPGKEWELEWPEHCSRYLKELVQDLSLVTAEILARPLDTSKRYTVRLLSSLNESAIGTGDLRAAVVSRLTTPVQLDVSEDQIESHSGIEDPESFEEGQSNEASSEECEKSKGESLEEGGEDEVGTEVSGEHTSIAGSEMAFVNDMVSQAVAGDPEGVKTKEGDDVTHGMPDNLMSQPDQAQGDEPAEKKSSVGDVLVKDPSAPLVLGE